MIIVLIDMSVVFRFGCDPKVYSIHLFIGASPYCRWFQWYGRREKISLCSFQSGRGRDSIQPRIHTNFIRDLGIESCSVQSDPAKYANYIFQIFEPLHLVF